MAEFIKKNFELKQTKNKLSSKFIIRTEKICILAKKTPR